jgi:hypothetical protein
MDKPSLSLFTSSTLPQPSTQECKIFGHKNIEVSGLPSKPLNIDLRVYSCDAGLVADLWSCYLFADGQGCSNY